MQTAMATAAAPPLALGQVVVSNSNGASSSASSSPRLWTSGLKCCLSGITRIDGGSRSGCSKLHHSRELNIESSRGAARAVRRGGWIARAQPEAGSSTMLAKEMERVAAKEALILSIKDAGGLKGLSDPAADERAKIDVNEKILSLERLNPTPRPTTSPMLEGLWQFEWARAPSPGVMAAKTLLGFPAAVASMDSFNLLILDGSAQARGCLKIFNTIESSFTLTTKITVEGPLRLKEEYVEGVVSTPTVKEGTVPSQIQGVVNELASALQRLPDTVKEVVNGGVKIPLSGTFSRELLISYLDEEILVARNKSGIPDVLLRLELPITDNEVIVPEYLS